MCVNVQLQYKHHGLLDVCLALLPLVLVILNLALTNCFLILSILDMLLNLLLLLSSDSPFCLGQLHVLQWKFGEVDCCHGAVLLSGMAKVQRQ